jgi:hypothetical protein
MLGVKEIKAQLSKRGAAESSERLRQLSHTAKMALVFNHPDTLDSL